jgi:hypothetical protein
MGRRRRKGKESASFLKKRSKKLSRLRALAKARQRPQERFFLLTAG